MGAQVGGRGRRGTASVLVTVATPLLALGLTACGADTEREGALAASDAFAASVGGDPRAA